jgi:restriction system protein
MPIPDYQTLMLPLLQFLSDKKEHNIVEAVESLSKKFQLTEEEKQQLLPSGQQTIIRNRIGWARTYMKKAGLVDTVRRGYFKITDVGVKVLSTNCAKIDVKFLEQFPDFITFRELRHPEHEEAVDSKINTETPDEALDVAYQRLRNNLEYEILQQLKTASPSFFEKVVVELLVKMGYGGNLNDAGQAVGHSGDGGIDGIIKEDRLGLDAIYIQAKRWEGTVGRPEIQKFAGGLQGHRSRKGVFITTSDYSKEAIDFVERIDSKIVLIDGKALAKFMVDYNLGVSIKKSYEIKEVDSDYFEEN